MERLSLRAAFAASGEGAPRRLDEGVVRKVSAKSRRCCGRGAEAELSGKPFFSPSHPCLRVLRGVDVCGARTGEEVLDEGKEEAERVHLARGKRFASEALRRAGRLSQELRCLGCGDAIFDAQDGSGEKASEAQMPQTPPASETLAQDESD